MGRFAMRLAGCAVAVVISTPALLVAGGGLGTVTAAGAASPCPADEPTGAAPGQQAPSEPGRPSTYPMGQCQLLLSTGVIPAGGTVTLVAYGFPAGAHVVISVGGTTLGSATADANGSFSAGETIPSSMAPGTYTVTASGGGQSLGAQLVVTGHGGSGATPGAATAALTSGGSSGGTSGGGSSPAASAAQSAAQGAAAQQATGGSPSSPGSSGTGSGSGVSHAVAPATLNHTTSTSALAWIALGALVLLVMAGGLLLAMRRRSGTSAS